MITKIDPRSMTLEEQYGAILSCCDQLLAALHAGGSSDQIGRIRMQLAGMLHANLAAEEIELNGPIRRLAPADRPREFAKMAEEAAYLRSLYSEHVGRWTLRSIDIEPASYANAASELVRDVKAHLTRKRALLPEWRQAKGART